MRRQRQRRRQVCILATILALCFPRTSHSFLKAASSGWSLKHTPTSHPATLDLAHDLSSSTSTPRLNFRALSETTKQLLHTETQWDTTSFQAVPTLMQSWALGNSKRAALNAEYLLRRVVEEQRNGNPHAECMDMTALYQTLILAWANSGEAGGAERAEEILDAWQEIYEQGDSDDPLLCGPGLDSFNAVIHAYAKSPRPDAPEQALRVLQKLYDWYIEDRTFATPNKETYAAVLRSWARKSHDAPSRVKKLLEHMEDLAETYPAVKPDFRCHNAYLYAVLEAVSRGDIPGRDGAIMAEDYLRNMLASVDEEVQVSER